MRRFSFGLRRPYSRAARHNRLRAGALKPCFCWERGVVWRVAQAPPSQPQSPSRLLLLLLLLLLRFLLLLVLLVLLLVLLVLVLLVLVVVVVG